PVELLHALLAARRRGAVGIVAIDLAVAVVVLPVVADFGLGLADRAAVGDRADASPPFRELGILGAAGLHAVFALADVAHLRVAGPAGWRRSDLAAAGLVDVPVAVVVEAVATDLRRNDLARGCGVRLHPRTPAGVGGARREILVGPGHRPTATQ